MNVVLSEINEVMDLKCTSEAIYLVFRKAFNSVSHEELPHKLWDIDITRSLWL